jgi:hypothetical protein
LQTQLNEAQAQANDQKKQLVEFEQEREDLLNNSTRSIDTEMVPPMGLPAPELEVTFDSCQMRRLAHVCCSISEMYYSSF